MVSLLTTNTTIIKYMLVEEEPKSNTEINPDALEAVFEEDVLIDEDIFVFGVGEDEDGVDIAFKADDAEDW